jgi:hypothetical protein
MTITIDRALRDVLREKLGSWIDFEGLAGDLAHGGDADTRAKTLAAVNLLDEIGWPADDGRKQFEVTLALGMIEDWLRPLADDLLVDIEHEVLCQARQEDGDPDYYFMGHSRDESIAMSIEQLARLRGTYANVVQLVEMAGAVA